jgi:hypothetical protein
MSASYSVEDACKVIKPKKFTDFTLRCNGVDFPVHQLIIYHRSDYFRAVLDNDFIEKKERLLDLKETTPAAVAAAIIWCYTNQLITVSETNAFVTQLAPASMNASAATSANEHVVQAEICFFCDVYVLANRLLIQSLVIDSARALMLKFQNTSWVAIENEGRPGALLNVLRHVYRLLPENSGVRSLLTGWIIGRGLHLLRGTGVFGFLLEVDKSAFTAANASVLASMPEFVEYDEDVLKLAEK